MRHIVITTDEFAAQHHLVLQSLFVDTALRGSEMFNSSTSAHQEDATNPVSGSMNWDPIRKRLLGTDSEDTLRAAQEIRRNIEIVHGREFSLMLSAFLPAFSSVLTQRTQPTAALDTVEQKIRRTILEVISKMPANDVLRPHASHLVALGVDILRRDYEENALIASRIIFSLYKAYRTLPNDCVQPYLDFVILAYRSLSTALPLNFTLPSGTPQESSDGPTSQGESGVPSRDKQSDSNSGKTHQVGLKANASFPVLTECPLMVMLMIQLYPKHVEGSIPVLIAVMMEALAVRAPRVDLSDTSLRRLFSSRNRELVAAQAKTLSFLTFLLKSFSFELKKYEDRLAGHVVDLMRVCPRESVSTRKELLVATRHLLNSEFRTGFFQHIDVLLDERVLIGGGRGGESPLRALGYTTLSDFVQHVRKQLTLSQLSRVVCIFSRVLHTNSLPFSTQYIAVRTLLSVVDLPHQSTNSKAQLGRDLLVRTLATMGRKLKFLKAYADAGYLGAGAETGAKQDALKDVQSMVRAIVIGHKTLLYYLHNYRNLRMEKTKESRPTIPIGSNEEVSSAMLKMTYTEVGLILEYIDNALKALPLCQMTDSLKQRGIVDKSSVDQYRDVLTYFAAGFACFDGFNLRRTLGKRLGTLFDAIVRDPSFMVIPRHLLAANDNISYEFCSILLEFVVDKLDLMAIAKPSDVIFIPVQPSGCTRSTSEHLLDSYHQQTQRPENSDDVKQRESSTLLQLMEKMLKSLATYTENEAIVRKRLRLIVSKCVKGALENATDWPDKYCMLLRYVFRSISAGKFEQSYRELLPLIPTVLNGLYRVVVSCKEVVELHHTVIELCLTIPARLSSLLPHLNLLLRVIVLALESMSGDLVNLG